LSVADQGSVQVIELTMNGEKLERTVLSRQLLVHFIRDTLGMRGTHIGCDTGNCGACSVIVDGKLVKSCMMLAVQADGLEVETVESLGEGMDGLDTLQEAFRAEHGLQCGYCTPGMVMAAVSLLDEVPNPTERQVREGLEGNLCRCTGYHNIVKSVLAAAESTS